MEKKFTVIEGGRRHQLTAEDALHRQMLKAALAGDARARRDLLRLREQNPKPKGAVDGSPESDNPRIVFMKDSTVLLIALGICVEVNGRCVLTSWAIEAARKRQSWTPLSPEDEKLLDDFGETDFKRAA
jgi:hypothetical protein